jgi:hypothetical protein
MSQRLLKSLKRDKKFFYGVILDIKEGKYADEIHSFQKRNTIF